MVMQPRLVLRTEQRLIMTAMLQQAISLLPLTRLELQQAVQQELMENPLLEEAAEETQEVADGEMPEAPENVPDTEQDERGEIEIDWENIVQDNYGLNNFAAAPAEDDFPSFEQTVSKPETLYEHLEWQLSMTTAPEGVRRVAHMILGNIDDNGYFQADAAELATQEGLGPREAEAALALVQGFDPPGVGARNLQECLLIQLKNLEAASDLEPGLLRLAEELAQNNLEQLQERNFSRLARSHGGTPEEIASAIQIIRALDPHPGSRFSQQRVEVVVPDVTVFKRGEDYDVVLNDDGLPPLRVSARYRALAADKISTPSDARRYLDERMRAALWFLKSIEQRRQTILKVSRSIVSFQRDFLEHGVNHLRPLVLRDVAEDIEMHESTVSRVTTGKYMETPRGVYSFKYFFHSGLVAVGGGNTSSVAVKEQIRKLIEEEDKQKPFTDQQIVEKLHEGQVLIARRTVTKYRKELRIPPASRRRAIH